MVKIKQIAEIALTRDSLMLRSVVQDFLHSNPLLINIASPQTDDMRVLAMSAALLELLAMRTNQEPPAWTANIGSVAEPVFLLKAAEHMKRLRALCQAESPEPLRKRHFYAPPGFLTFA